jgi:hypothetical protein
MCRACPREVTIPSAAPATNQIISQVFVVTILQGYSLSVCFGGEIGIGAALIVSKLFKWGKISKFQTTALANKSRP